MTDRQEDERRESVAIDTDDHSQRFVYDTNRSKAELFVEQFYDVSADKNLTPDFMAHRIKFESQHRDEIHSAAVKSDESNGKTNNASETSFTTPDDHTINSQFEMHELTEAIKLCKNNSSPGADRISYEMLKMIPKRIIRRS